MGLADRSLVLDKFNMEEYNFTLFEITDVTLKIECMNLEFTREYPGRDVNFSVVSLLIFLDPFVFR